MLYFLWLNDKQFFHLRSQSSRRLLVSLESRWWNVGNCLPRYNEVACCHWSPFGWCWRLCWWEVEQFRGDHSKLLDEEERCSLKLKRSDQHRNREASQLFWVVHSKWKNEERWIHFLCQAGRFFCDSVSLRRKLHLWSRKFKVQYFC